MGLMDQLAMMQDASGSQKATVNKLLSENNLPGLYELLNHAWDITDKVLRKKKISNEIEYYAIVEQLSRIDAPLDEKQRNVLGEAMLKFEKRKS